MSTSESTDGTTGILVDFSATCENTCSTNPEDKTSGAGEECSNAQTAAPNKMQLKSSNFTTTLKSFTKELLSIVSDCEVVQRLGAILASSCNEDILKKLSRLLVTLLELCSDMSSGELLSAFGKLPFLYCLHEAIKQTSGIDGNATDIGQCDLKTTFVFIDVMGEILSYFNNSHEEKQETAGAQIDHLLRDNDGQKDDQFPPAVCDTLTKLVLQSEDVKSCATITKVLRVFWNKVYTISVHP